MGEQKPEKTKKHICAGLLAHVDAGKTTLSESMLYLTGSIRKLGRVDHRDAFLDTDEMERARGITIFSKQARFSLKDKEVTLLDTPGHVDFSAEMERTLQVLDYAILVISGADGIQGHVETLWRLLSRYQIPAFLFVNKMDQPGTEREALLTLLKERLDQACMDFSAGQDSQDFYEELAMCDEALLEAYMEKNYLETAEIGEAIAKRQIFPVFFGSALKVEGVDRLLEGLDRYCICKEYPAEFGARVYKIARDEQGKRLTYLKVTGGSLKVKMLLSNRPSKPLVRQQGSMTQSSTELMGRIPKTEATEPADLTGRAQESEAALEIWEEKADQLRLYAGASFEAVQEVCAGQVCAVTGLTKTYAGQGLGWETESLQPMLQPVLTYRIKLPEDCDVHRMYVQLRALEEEEPQLHILWAEGANEIHAQVMGEVQIEVLKHQITERFGVKAEFDQGSIVYKETITESAEGVGHFEPLRHYAEVHLWMEPLPRGSGLQFFSDCSEDALDKNWQRLVLTHLEERKHPGVLTGSEITDMKITLVAGRAHLKHTEGGDFRQATYRAVRQGLMQAKSRLLEPVYAFRLEVPTENVGRAMTDVQKMQGSFTAPVMEGEMSLLTGTAPVVTMRGYQTEVTAYTRGRGRLSCTLEGYEPCHNEEEVVAAIGYDPEADTENPAGSVFCAHGAGFLVPWYQVKDYMHIENVHGRENTGDEADRAEQSPAGRRQTALPEGVSQEELEEIFIRTYGPIKRERYGFEKRKRSAGADRKTTGSRSGAYAAGQAAAAGSSESRRESPAGGRAKGSAKDSREYLLVDGYNIIFAWDELRELSEINIESARGKLMDILCNYQGFRKCTLILVFDAYRVPGGQGSVQKYHNIHVVYTKEAETADQYIEKTVHAMGRHHHVTVATSDALEQVIIFGQGAARLSARELLEEVERTNELIRETNRQRRSGGKNYLFDHMPEEMAEMMEEIRLGRRSFPEQQDE